MAGVKRKANCPICTDKVREPVTFALCRCEVIFCQACLEEWISNNAKCPTCTTTVKITRNKKVYKKVKISEIPSDDEDSESDSEAILHRARQIASSGEVGHHFRQLEEKSKSSRLGHRALKDADEESARVAFELSTAEEQAERARQLEEQKENDEKARAAALSLQAEEDALIRSVVTLEDRAKELEANEALARRLQETEDAETLRQRRRQEKLDFKTAQKLSKKYSSSSSKIGSKKTDDIDDDDDDDSSGSVIIDCCDSEEEEE